MKAAILLCGLTRSFYKTHINFMKTIRNLDYDIFLYTWNDHWVQKVNMEKSLIKRYYPKIMKIDKYENHKQQFERLFSRARYILTSTGSKEKQFKLIYSGFFLQFFTLNKCFSLIKNPEEYDVFLKCRFDFNPLFELNIDEIKNDLNNNIYCPNLKMPGIGQFKMNDLFLVSDFNGMKKYCETYNYLLDNDEIIDVCKQHKCFSAEFFSSYFLDQHNIKIQGKYWPYQLISRKDVLRNAKIYK